MTSPNQRLHQKAHHDDSISLTSGTQFDIAHHMGHEIGSAVTVPPRPTEATGHNQPRVSPPDIAPWAGSLYIPQSHDQGDVRLPSRGTDDPAASCGNSPSSTSVLDRAEHDTFSAQSTWFRRAGAYPNR